tara:strand:+ start:907 stop:1323 length:417 start_codon:yes stop_codon:yes gene_type:complete
VEIHTSHTIEHLVRATFVFRGKYDLGKVDFGSICYIGDKEWFYRESLRLNVCNNTASLNMTIKRLLDRGIIKVVKPGKRPNPYIYGITGKGKRMYNEFVKMLENGHAKRNPDIYTMKSYRDKIFKEKQVKFKNNLKNA